ncbi:hypothetical protein BSF41_22850 [Flavobacterium sp. ACN2]|jgi:hypothetical protein|uniref:hypothetical protein n=1 Tax=Flavobacterium sp. ACN2 TaxID=1975676 RepID=UPI000BB3D003|nr:hypothetical protein [Flavobacterium sp. ACN2]PBI88917.1 hypothetical protein BSF41_22850 [Flavobacterium sp. ACN2]
MAILKRIENDELYLYMNGVLIYKRWLNTGNSKIFDIMAYDKYTLMSYTDLQYENSNELLSVKAKIKLKDTVEGGRRTGIISGYRPNHVFEYGIGGKINQTFMGDIIFENQSTIELGEEKIVTVRFLLNQSIEKYLNKGQVWWIHEGPNLIGNAEIL